MYVFCKYEEWDYMLALKFFVFIGIVGFLVDSVKKVKQDNTTKQKISVSVAVALLLFGLYMLVDAFM